MHRVLLNRCVYYRQYRPYASDPDGTLLIFGNLLYSLNRRRAQTTNYWKIGIVLYRYPGERCINSAISQHRIRIKSKTRNEFTTVKNFFSPLRFDGKKYKSKRSRGRCASDGRRIISRPYRRRGPIDNRKTKAVNGFAFKVLVSRLIYLKFDKVTRFHRSRYRR